MRLLNRQEAAELLNVKVASLSDKRYRFRIGLPAVKIGHKVFFTESDIEKLIARGREKFPLSTARAHK